MSKPREWTLTSENLVHKVMGPSYSSNEEIRVIEYSAYQALERKLSVAKDALESICDNRCAEQNPCEAKEALKTINEGE